MCNCKETVAERAEGGRVSVFSEIERYGYSLVRIQRFRISDGKPSNTFQYPGVDWTYCPFCGKKLK